MTAKLSTIFTTQELALLIAQPHICSVEDLSIEQDVWINNTLLIFTLFHLLFLDWRKQFSSFLELLFSISTPSYRGEDKAGVRTNTDYLFDNPDKMHRYPWIHDWYRQYVHRYHYDPFRGHRLRDQINKLAQTPFLQSPSKQGAKYINSNVCSIFLLTLQDPLSLIFGKILLLSSHVQHEQ